MTPGNNRKNQKRNYQSQGQMNGSQNNGTRSFQNQRANQYTPMTKTVRFDGPREQPGPRNADAARTPINLMKKPEPKPSAPTGIIRTIVNKRSPKEDNCIRGEVIKSIKQQDKPNQQADWEQEMQSLFDGNELDLNW